MKLLEDCVSNRLSWNLLSWHSEGGTATSSVRPPSPPTQGGRVRANMEETGGRHALVFTVLPVFFFLFFFK